eukprot:TRINITY_DN62583_c0_g1_i1.p1 TRINITY_DN62583_c0_g1~~TRINITY_DN62583_c0_g1_i1.p1  ORF type:complete len:416 (-),score=65.19 TRINITY_DN62583_c0_g1_i1:64-1311(-)
MSVQIDSFTSHASGDVVGADTFGGFGASASSTAMPPSGPKNSEATGVPFWQTLESCFPCGILPSGIENALKGRIRKRLRDVGYRVAFLPGEPWEHMIELFAIAGLDRIHRGYGDNPWFWVVSWPEVLGAAAADFWPDVGPAQERRRLATAAAAGHLEALLMSRALGNSQAFGALPEPAVKGLRAIGQSSVPALPHFTIDRELPNEATGGSIMDAASRFERPTMPSGYQARQAIEYAARLYPPAWADVPAQAPAAVGAPIIPPPLPAATHAAVSVAPGTPVTPPEVPGTYKCGGGNTVPGPVHDVIGSCASSPVGEHSIPNRPPPPPPSVPKIAPSPHPPPPPRATPLSVEPVSSKGVPPPPPAACIGGSGVPPPPPAACIGGSGVPPPPAAACIGGGGVPPPPPPPPFPQVQSMF